MVLSYLMAKLDQDYQIFAREPLTNCHKLSEIYGVCGKARFAGNVETLPRSATQSTGPVDLALRERFAFALALLSPLTRYPHCLRTTPSQYKSETL